MSEILTKRSTRKMRVLTFRDIQRGKKFTKNVAIQLTVLVSPIDLGALAYLKRTKKRNEWNYQVCEASLSKVRVNRLSSWVDHVCLHKQEDSSINANIKSVKRFIDYCEKNNCKLFLDTELKCRNAYVKYTNYLNSRIRDQTLSHEAAGLRQSQARRFVEECFDLQDPAILQGLQVIKKNTNKLPNTEISGSEQRIDNFRYLLTMLKSISEFCLSNAKYPAQLDIGGEQRWVFPNSAWILNSSGKRSSRHSYAIDYESGRVLSFTELKNVSSTKQHKLFAIKRAHELIDASNKNHRDRSRIRLAMQAHDAFLLMFLAATGMNLSGARNMKFSEDYKIEKTSGTIRTIKYRAGGKLCIFSIENVFLPYWRRYLELRKYIVGERSVKWFFFHIDKKSEKLIFKQISISFSWEAADRFRREIDSSIEIIGARKWRANKGDDLLRDTDITTAADMLQNTEKTVRKSYAIGSADVAKDEMTEFFNNGLPCRRTDLSDGEETPMGSCKDYGNPETVSGQFKQADCATWEGCLGCNKYAYIADAVDVRKLLSAKAVTLSTKHLSTSKEMFEEYFEFFLDRIDKIIDEIVLESAKHKAMVKEISKEVSDGYYDDYWMAKHKMLLNLGVIND